MVRRSRRFESARGFGESPIERGLSFRIGSDEPDVGSDHQLAQTKPPKLGGHLVGCRDPLTEDGDHLLGVGDCRLAAQVGRGPGQGPLAATAKLTHQLPQRRVRRPLDPDIQDRPYLPEEHRRAALGVDMARTLVQDRHSNLIERTFGETRRRVKVIGRLPGERSYLSLV
jgi:hypothetical protein